MSDNFISSNNNGRRRNFQGSLPSTNYQMPANFAQKDIQFPKAPSLGEFTPSNSGIKRDWSGSEMQVPEFKGLNAVGKGLQGKYDSMKSERKADEKERTKKPTKVVIVGSEGENDNPAPRTRPDGSPIKPFPSFGDDSEDVGPSGSSKDKREIADNGRPKGTLYKDEDGEVMWDPEGNFSMGDVGMAAGELGKQGAKAAGRLAKRVGAKVLQKGKERLGRGGGNSSQFDSTNFDDDPFSDLPPLPPQSGNMRRNNPPPRPFPPSLKDDPFA